MATPLTGAWLRTDCALEPLSVARNYVEEVDSALFNFGQSLSRFGFVPRPRSRYVPGGWPAYRTKNRPILDALEKPCRPAISFNDTAVVSISRARLELLARPRRMAGGKEKSLLTILFNAVSLRCMLRATSGMPKQSWACARIIWMNRAASSGRRSGIS